MVSAIKAVRIQRDNTKTSLSKGYIMIERAFHGSPRYYAWIVFLLSLCMVALYMFILQQRDGLTITSMSRDVPWGFYIAQLTFLVGVAASAVMVVLPYYMHDYKAFGQITILGEFLAIPAVILCPLFVFVDLGQPIRVMNLFLYPSLKSMLFWDTIALFGYLIINIIIARKTLYAEINDLAPAKWVKTLIYISIPWAISIHTITAFLYCGLPGRPFWFTAVLVPRFLASAFAAGPALLIILCYIVRKTSTFNPSEVAIQTLARIVTYAMFFNLFLFGAEIFTIIYSGIGHHANHLKYLFLGIDGKISGVVPFMWLSVVMGIVSLIFLLNPNKRKNSKYLIASCILIFVSVWIDKGAGMLTGGFIPSPSGKVTSYFPSLIEVLLGMGIYAFGALLLTILYKIAITIKEEAVLLNDEKL